MRVYKLRLKPPVPQHLDYFDALLVVAKDSKAARRAAHEYDRSDTEGSPWLDSSRSSCRSIDLDAFKHALVLLSSFVAG